MSAAELEVREPQAIAPVSDALSVDELVGQVQLIQRAMSVAMRDGDHYGVIPGTDKPTLLKPGAEKLCLLFRLDPEYDWTERWDGEHYTVTARCTLYHIPTGNRVASGLALCSTRETKYAYRNLNRTCPACGAEAIIKGKAQYGGGWLCWKKKDGCGAKFEDGDPVIEDQEVGRKDNDALADTYNTVLKMSCKRALVAAVLNGTAASDIFTQDLDDSDERSTEPEPAVDGENETHLGSSRSPGSVDLSRLNAILHDLSAMALPDGVKSWPAFAARYAKENFGAAKWSDLTPEQLDVVCEYLNGYTLPL